MNDEEKNVLEQAAQLDYPSQDSRQTELDPAEQAQSPALPHGLAPEASEMSDVKSTPEEIEHESGDTPEPERLDDSDNTFQSDDNGSLPPIDMGPVMKPEVPASGSDYTVTIPEPGKLQQAWKEKRLLVTLSGIFLVLAVLALVATIYVYLVIHPFETYDKILPNVYCAGVDLGGMTKEEAQEAVEEALRYPAYSVQLILPDCEYTFHPAQEGITLNGAEVAQAAYDYGRSDPSAYGVYKAFHHAQKTEYRLNAETDLVFRREDIEAEAEQIFSETEIKPTETTAACDMDQHTVTLTMGQPGRRIDPQTITDAVCAAFDDMVFSDITLEYEKVEIDMPATRKVCRQAAREFSVAPTAPVIVPNEETHAIDLTMGIQGWKANGNALYALAKEDVQQERYGQVTLDMTAIEPQEVDITDAYYALACDPVEPYYSGGVVYESTYGYTLDWDAAVAEIVDADYGQQLSIAMTPIAPELTKAEVEAVLFRDQLSSFSTPHTANSNRTHNLSLACEAIDGTVINAGETFSFNNVVGERTASKGYREAIVYVGTESKDEVGGGICQVASTVYDAALYAEMEITSRACHTFFVTYVEGGLDATVYWGSLDFCFRNNTKYPIRVNASVSGGYVRISIDGTKTNDHVVKLSSTCLSTKPYSTVYEYDSSKPKGYEKETTYPYTGYTYEAYQYIYDGSGNLLETNYLGTSTYDKRDRVITVGTG